MKIAYVLIVLLVVFMVGCATAPEEPPAAVPTAPEEPPAAPEEPPAAPEAPAAEAEAEAEAEAPAPVEGDIVVKNAGFDPDELTVTVGSTLTIVSAEGKHKLTIDGKTTPVIEEGSAHDVTFDKLGKIRVFDILTKKSAYVTVEEAAGEAAE